MSGPVSGGVDVVIGRGDKGKSWLMRTVAERALAAGRPVFIADCDTGNRTLAEAMTKRGGVTVLQPSERGEAAKGEFIRDVVQDARGGKRFLLDPGANDRTVAAVSGTALPVAAIQAAEDDWGIGGLTDIDVFESCPVTVWYLTGADPYDMPLLQTVLDSPLARHRLVVVRNSGVLRATSTVDGDPWNPIVTTKVYERALKAGAKVMTLPALTQALAVKLTAFGIPFREAIRGEAVMPIPGSKEKAPLNPWERQALQTYVTLFTSAATEAGVREWLP